MPPTAKRRSGGDPVAILAEIERFLSTCQEPVLIEPGEPAIVLRPEGFRLHPRPPGCVLEVWGETGGLVRRLVAAGPAAPGRLPLKARAFGGGEVDLEILDSGVSARRIERLDGEGRFAKFFARLLAREFPQHRVNGLTAAPDLQRSLSSSYLRGVLLQGEDSWAAFAAPPDASAEVCDQILTFGLLWLSEVRGRRRSRTIAGLRLFLPEGRATATLQRLPWLDQTMLRWDVWEYNRSGAAHRCDPHGAPPPDAELPLCQVPPQLEGWVRELSDVLASRAGVAWRARPDGLISFEVGGLSFARAGGRTLTFGLESDVLATPASAGRILALAEELLRFRSAESRDLTHPLYLARPESWLAERVRMDPTILLPNLRRQPLYTSVPAVFGRARGVLDLLGIDLDGRLVILELKASEDIHLPLQALDYWLRVRNLAASGALPRRGYFPGLMTLSEPPRLILAAPALQFHPRTDTILTYLSKSISIERLGLGSDWRRELRVEFRRSGG